MSELLSPVLSCLEKANNIYIYGTGKYGKRCYEWLSFKMVKIKAFIESDTGKQDYLGIPVYSSPEYLHSIKEDDAIILAMNPEFQIIVRRRLEAHCNIKPIMLSAEQLLSLNDGFWREIEFLKEYYPIEPYRGENDWKNILVVRLDVVGDLIFTTPFLRELRRNYQEANITLVIRSANFFLMEECPYVNEVLLYDISEDEFNSCDYNKIKNDAKIFAKKNLKKVDVVFLPREISGDNIIANIYLAIYSGATLRIARADCMTKIGYTTSQMMGTLFSLVVNHTRPQHECQRILEMLKSVKGHVYDESMELWPSKGDSQFAKYGIKKQIGHIYVALGIVSRDENRSWGINRYVELIKSLNEEFDNIHFITIGGKEASNKICNIQKDMPYNIIDLVGKTNLKQVVGLISECDLYLGSNTGLMHIAAAMKIPIIEISAHLIHGNKDGVISPFRCGAWRVPHVTLQPSYGLSKKCHETGWCIEKFSHCINLITVPEVKNAFVELSSKCSLALRRKK